MPLTKLPTELLAHIGQYLDNKSLETFSLVSSQCRSSVAQWLFETVRLRQACSALELCEMLKRTSYGKYVRCLKADRYSRPVEEDPVAGISTFSGDALTREAPAYLGDTEIVLGSLLQVLTSLRDMIVADRIQATPHLLRILSENQHLAACRLHIRCWPLSGGNSSTFTEHELALIKSPNLHSVWFYRIQGIRYDDVSLLARDLISQTGGLPPNLRHIRLFQSFASSFDMSTGPYTMQWMNELAESSLSTPQGLGGLRISDTSIERRELEEWSRVTKFAVLEHLVLDGYCKGDAVNFLAGLSFEKLRTLDVRLSEDSHAPEDVLSPEYRLLRSLPSLVALRISGNLTKRSLFRALEHHGSTLTRLHLLPKGKDLSGFIFDGEGLSLLQRHCVLLEDLHITIHRTLGDADEVEMYRTLGRIPRLQTLDLTLNTSYHIPDLEALASKNGINGEMSSLDKSDIEPVDLNLSTLIPLRKGHIRTKLINSALDADLARAIFLETAGAKPNRNLPLIRMSIRTDGGEFFGNARLPSSIAAPFRHELQRRWLVKKELGLPKDDVQVRQLPYPSRHHRLCTELDPMIEDVFRRLWPEKRPGSYWKDDWHSFPLCVDDGAGESRCTDD